MERDDDNDDGKRAFLREKIKRNTEIESKMKIIF